MDAVFTDALWGYFIGGLLTIVGSVLSYLFGRQRAKSESGKLDSESESLMSMTIKTFQDIYQDMLKDQLVRITRLETEQVASSTRIVGLEKLVREQEALIISLRNEIDLLRKQLVKEGHVPETPGDKNE